MDDVNEDTCVEFSREQVMEDDVGLNRLAEGGEHITLLPTEQNYAGNVCLVRWQVDTTCKQRAHAKTGT